MTSDKDHYVEIMSVPQCHKSSPGAQMPPFPLLLGEHPQLLSQTIEGNAMVTNWRFCVSEKKSFLSVPLQSFAELTLVEANRWMRIGCKDGSTYCCTFATMEDCRKCHNVLREIVGLPHRLQDLFAFTFYTAVTGMEMSGGTLSQADVDQIALCKPVSPVFAYTFGKEVKRLGFDTSRHKIWRMSHANNNYEFCPTYPKTHLLPATVSDEKLKDSLDFRALKRFPSVVWRDKSSGMVLIRSSQPLSSFLGVSYFTNDADLLLLEEVVKACKTDWELIQAERQNHLTPPVSGEVVETQGYFNGHGDGSSQPEEDGAQGGLVGQGGGASNGHGASNGVDSHVSNNARMLAIVDCRSTAGVWGNSLKGGGTEDEAVYMCKRIHLDLSNIHVIRDSFNKLRTLCHSYPEGTYMKNLSSSQWLVYLSHLLRGANVVVELMKTKQRPVLVHCSDGWDRTAQICSLAELLMDPYYRTIEGFQVLVEREWLHFGHKFGERGGHDPKCTDTNQQSPIFLQFLDCVYQLTLQYPAEFEFNESYLMKLLKHSQACLFGTFLHNCPREREACKFKSASVWSLLQPGNTRFINLLYKPKQEVLFAKFMEHELELWKSVYMEGNISHTDPYMEPLLDGEDNSTAAEPLPRTRSMEDLSKGNADNTRRNSDPSITPGQEPGAAADLHNTSTSSVEVLHGPEEPANQILQNGIAHSQEEEVLQSNSEALREENQSKSNSDSNNLTADTKSLGSNDQDSCVEECNERKSVSCEKLNGDVSKAGIHQQDVRITNGNSLDSGLSVDIPSSCSSLDTVGHEPDSDAGCDDGRAIVNMECNGKVSFNNCELDSNKVDSTEGLSVNGLDKSLNGLDKSVNGYFNGLEKSVNGLDKKKDLYSEVVSKDSRRCESSKTLSCDHLSLLSERLAEDENSHLCNGHVKDNEHSDKVPDLIKEVTNGDVQHSPSENSTPTEDIANNCHSSTPSPKKMAAPSPPSVMCKSVSSISTDTQTVILEESPQSSLSSSISLCSSRQIEVKTDRLNSSSHSSTSTVTSPGKKEIGESPEMGSPLGQSLLSRRARAASGASRDLSVSPSAGNWTDTGRLRHLSGSDSSLMRRGIRATVSTSTTDISDSCVGQILAPSMDRHTNIRQRMDVDGLTLTCDPRQELLGQLISSKDQKILELEQRLQRFADIIRRGHHLQQTVPAVDDMLMSDSEGGEPSSLGATSNPSLDSWEALDESDARVVPWVPDHIVTHCAGCDSAFWIGRWKHHCRNCGKVFCDECSNYRAPVPHAHINKPERVCHRCHSLLMQLSPGASSDGRIPTLVADG